jgi:cytoskeletal protein CcmA (bactofilin family)
MWRKQEEPKGNTANSSPDVREQPRVEQAAPVPVAAPTAAPVTPSVSVREATPPAAHLTSTLVIKGEITGRDDLYIDGEVQGKIRLEQGKLTIGPNGRVTADVDAKEIVIRGQVKGNLNGRDRVEIGKTGRATGDVITQRILVEDGAEIHGHVEIKRAEPRPQAPLEPAQEKTKANPPVAAAAAPAVVTSAVAGKPATGSAAEKNGSEPVATPSRASAPVA